MKPCSRNALLVISALFFVCVSDHVVWLLVPHILKAANKTAAKVYKMALKAGRIVQHI